MHWVLQENLYNEQEWINLVAALERFKIPYSVHKVVPFSGELIPPAEPKQEKVICFGSYSMRHAAKTASWNPGVYDLFDTDFRIQQQHWGELMLNNDAVVSKFKNACVIKDSFVRPVNDSKYFAGAVFSAEEFEAWQTKVCVLHEDYGNSMTEDTLVQVCKPKKIYAEYRFWIVDKRVATASLYKRGDRVIYSSMDTIDKHVFNFVDQVLNTTARERGVTLSMSAQGWNPHRAYVLDVCETPDGMKIVEINTINASGFYAGNVQDIVLSLEQMERK